MIYHRKQKVFHDEEHRKAWLIKTTLNCCQKISGSMWRKRTVPLEELSRGVYPFASGSENTVYAALCELPEIYRTVLHLFYFEDLSCDEIGRALKLRPGTVRMRLTRGREMMRDLLKGEYEFER